MLIQSPRPKITISPEMAARIALVGVLRLSTSARSIEERDMVQGNALLEAVEHNGHSEERPAEPNVEDPYDFSEEWSPPYDPIPAVPRKPRYESGNDTDSAQFVESPRESLADTLKEQLNLCGLEGSDREIGEYLIGSIDDDGYLAATLDEIAEDLTCGVDTVESVLAVIQTFEPSGVGARNLPECLMIQLRDRDLEDSLAMRVVRNHFDDLLRRKYDRIARDLRIDREQLAEAKRVIATLDPKPGFEYEPYGNPNIVTPELVVRRFGDEFITSLADPHGSIRLVSNYRSILKQSARYGSEARTYVREQVASARWFLRSLHMRRQTMLRVMRRIVECQPDFFLHGESHLRPLRQYEIANDLGLHESTVSRACNGKYVLTPHGTFEMGSFFGGGRTKEGGAAVGVNEIKARIRELIRDENPRKPLSDRKTADLLRDEGIAIPRRTVAKYRDEMGIPGRHLRGSIC